MKKNVLAFVSLAIAVSSASCGKTVLIDLNQERTFKNTPGDAPENEDLSANPSQVKTGSGSGSDSATTGYPDDKGGGSGNNADALGQVRCSAGVTLTRVRYKASSAPEGMCLAQSQERKCGANLVFDDWKPAQASAEFFEATTCEETRQRFRNTPALPGVTVVADPAASNAGVPAETIQRISETCEREIQKRTLVEGVAAPWSGSFSDLQCVQAVASCEAGIASNLERYRFFRNLEKEQPCAAERQMQSCDAIGTAVWSGSATLTQCSSEYTFFRTSVSAPGAKCESQVQTIVYTAVDGNYAQGQPAQVTQSAAQFVGPVQFTERTCTEYQATCTAGKACPIANGTGTTACEVVPPSLIAEEVCKVQTCNAGFAINGNTCIAVQPPPPASCGLMQSGSSRDMFTIETGATGACAAGRVTQVCTDGVLTPPSAFGTCTETKSGYLAATVPFGSTCQQRQATRSCVGATCTNWSLNLVDTCSVQPAASCGPLQSGSSQVMFSIASGGNGACAAGRVTQVCTDGVLTPATAFDTCTETRTGYLAASVPFGSTCQQRQATRSCVGDTCTNWSINLFDTCSVQAPVACGTTPHGGTRIAYNVPQAGLNGCASQSQTCSNGTFVPATYNQTSCREVQTMYTLSVAPAGSSCSTYAVSAQRTCQNGACGTWPGNYFSSCSVQQCTQLNNYNYWQPSALSGTQCGCTNPGQRGQNHPDHPKYLACRQGNSPTSYTWQVINATTGSIYMSQCGAANPSQRGQRHPVYADMYCASAPGSGSASGYVWRYY